MNGRRCPHCGSPYDDGQIHGRIWEDGPIQCSTHIDCPAHGADHSQYARGCLDCPGCAWRCVS